MNNLGRLRAMNGEGSYRSDGFTKGVDYTEGWLLGSILIAWLVALMLGSFLTPVGAIAGERASSEGWNVKFKWAFCAVVRTENGRQLLPMATETTLHTGDKLKMRLELERKCFVYVILHDSQGALRLLFPSGFKHANLDPNARFDYFIPKGNQWYELDDHFGREKIYLLASINRLSGLEKRLRRYDTAKKKAKAERLSDVLSEIRRLRSEHSELKSIAERPATMIGQVRSGENVEQLFVSDLSNFSIDVSADDFYCMTYVIEHR
jgi:hypothetical protein